LSDIAWRSYNSSGNRVADGNRDSKPGTKNFEEFPSSFGGGVGGVSFASAQF
jgi:hypothetical protein